VKHAPPTYVDPFKSAKPRYRRSARLQGGGPAEPLPTSSTPFDVAKQPKIPPKSALEGHRRRKEQECCENNFSRWYKHGRQLPRNVMEKNLSLCGRVRKLRGSTLQREHKIRVRISWYSIYVTTALPVPKAHLLMAGMSIVIANHPPSSPSYP
jgi:hypothetical protein